MIRLLTRRKPQISGNGISHGTSSPIAFMHIPKTSGVAVISALAAHHPPASIVGGFDRSLFGCFDAFDTMDSDIRRNIYDSPSALPPQCGLIAGHFAYSTLAQRYAAPALMTVLREPVSRLLSHWMFWRSRGADELKGFGGWAEFVRYGQAPLAAFLDAPRLACQTDNLALRMLLWPHPLIKDDQFIDPAHDRRLLRVALRRLRGFAFVDIVENQAFANNLERWLNVRLSYETANETNSMQADLRVPLQKEFSITACRSLTARSRLDLALWTWIAKKQMPGVDPAALSSSTLLANVARYSVLMSKAGIEPEIAA